MKRLQQLLWVEDQPEVVASLQPLLEDLVETIRHVTDRASALQELRSGNYDFVLLDLQLSPGHWEGLELLREIEPQVQELPILVLSGAGTLKQCNEARRLGAREYVLKEDARDELAARMRKILDDWEKQRPLLDYARVQRLEKDLQRIVLGALREQAVREGKDLFRAFVPTGMALKAYERWHMEETGAQEDFLDLLDYATLIEKYWGALPIFQSLEKLLNAKTRDDRTRWLKAANEARRVIAHASRGELSSELRQALGYAESIVSRWSGMLSQNA